MLGEYRVYLGTYTSGESAADGIGLAWADENGRLRGGDSAAETPDPSFLALAPDGSALYAVSERQEGRVVAFAVHEDGTLTEINSQPSLGAAPCYLSVHPSGRFLLTANYLSGNLVVHRIDEGGVLREPCHLVQHSGSGPNTDRQEGPHAHQILPDPTGRHLLAVDLGTDSVYVYDFDADSGHVALKVEATLRAGAGPRHLAFHPSGTRLYLINELASTITEFGYEPDTGALEPGHTLSTLPEGSDVRNLAAEVVVSADGRFVYGSNRGHDSIAVFGSGTTDGGFRLLEIQSAEVGQPRHITFSPDGRFLFAAGQSSDTVQAFEVGTTGVLKPVGEPLRTPSPVCVLPVPGW